MNAWREATHQGKVGMIIEAYGKGFVTIGEMASHISSALGCKLQSYHINSVYRVNIRNDGDLKNYPLQAAPPPFVADVDLAETLWRAGLTGEEVAKKLGITRNQVYWLIDRNRERFSRRVIRPGSPVEQKREVITASYPDRVTRITPTGARITLPRVQFIDGAPA